MRRLKALVVGTRLEPMARRIWRRARELSVPRQAPENDDRTAFRVMERHLRRDSACIDVGAHDGVYLREMVRLAPEGQHVAFEPIPWLAEGLRHRFPTVDVRACAASDTTGTSEFSIFPRLPGFSGLRRRGDLPSDEPVEQVEVETVRIDDVVGATRRVDLIKVDVEGAELSVFKGARATLDRCRPVLLFEHGRGADREYGTTPEMLYDLLFGEFGYRIFTTVECLANEGALSRQQFADTFAANLIYNFVAFSQQGATRAPERL